ncbi:MAG: hypothetical protein J6Q10_01060 [Clostridia bacterium]|nr:hypothetical protein [Clostridia bacterium]
MNKEKLSAYFSSNHRDHKLFVFTVFAFLFLALESVFSETSALFVDGHIVFSVQLSITKILSIFIYLSTTILIACAVRYKLLLIPDLFLLMIKIYTATTGIIALCHSESALVEITYLEKTVEGILFSLFLISLIVGKLLKKPQSLVRKVPFFCLLMLLLCLPFTIFFEVAKLATSLTFFHKNTFITVFNFSRVIINEICLILPYGMLILVMYFVPEKTFKAFKNHLLHMETTSKKD